MREDCFGNCDNASKSHDELDNDIRNEDGNNYCPSANCEAKEAVVGPDVWRTDFFNGFQCHHSSRCLA